MLANVRFSGFACLAWLVTLNSKLPRSFKLQMGLEAASMYAAASPNSVNLAQIAAKTENSWDAPSAEAIHTLRGQPELND